MMTDLLLADFLPTVEMSRQNELLDYKSAEAMTHEGDWCASRGLWRLVGRAQAAAEAAKRFSIGGVGRRESGLRVCHYESRT